MTTLRQCSCKSEYQDEVYGKGIRLYTIGVNKSTCTVCAKEVKGEVKGSKKEK